MDPLLLLTVERYQKNLIESEMFGHCKGSFTGAIKDNIGLFRQADRGLLFLDEIADLPMAVQTKLLRVLQERVVRPVGGDQSFPVNVRIVAASSRDLKDMVEKGSFREDLFYRLNVVKITLPPLRERKADIPHLTRYILQKFGCEDPVASINPAALEALIEYDYPGNVRELENILERALVLSGGYILPAHLSDISKGDKRDLPLKFTEIITEPNLELPSDLDKALGVLEKHFLERALEKEWWG